MLSFCSNTLYFQNCFSTMAPPSRMEFWADYLHSSRLVTNTVLVTGDGGHKVLHISEISLHNVCTHKATHAVLLATASNLLANLLGSNNDTEKVVILPDFSSLQVTVSVSEFSQV